jgi:hypothetical protein
MYRREEIALMFRISRGCYWGKCAFCNTRDIPFQQPDPERVYGGLKEMIEENGNRLVHFTDDSAPLNILDHISRRLIEDGINLRWGCNLRFEKNLTMERLMRYSEAGCYAVYFGLESAHPRVLKLMNKGIDLENVERILKDMTWTAIKPYVYMIVGFPTETEEEALASFKTVKDFLSKGLIAGCIYNKFEITSPSPVSEHPDRFTISDWEVDSQRDLNPPVNNFKARGMSREAATRLMHTFLTDLGAQVPGLSEVEATLPREVKIGDRMEPVAFDLAEVRNLVMRRISTSRERVSHLIQADGDCLTLRPVRAGEEPA